MKFQPTAIADVILITPVIYPDNRGYFFEAYHQDLFSKNGIVTPFVQDNQSFSTQGTLRGLHYQIAPKAQAKLIRVLEGEIIDVAVDIRPQSPTYRQSVSIPLSAKDHTMLYIPAGFAHGFFVTSPTATIVYKCSEFYSPEHECSIRWNDPTLAINWSLGTTEPIVSAKDQIAPFLT